MLVGAWSLEVAVPGAPVGRTVFEWTLNQQFLTQRTEVPDPNVPDSLALIAVSDDGSYTQHYFDSRGVVRVYAMELRNRRWTLVRDRPDFSPLPFGQRFTGTLSLDGNRIDGAWERTTPDRGWQRDFAVSYVRTGS